MLVRPVRLVTCLTCLVCFGTLGFAEGLVAHYPLDRGRGDLAHDVGPGKRPGKIVFAKWGKSEHGTALEFDGKTAYVDCGPGKALKLKDRFSLCAWIFPTGAPSKEPVIVGEGPRSYAMTYYKDHVYLYVASGGNYVRSYAPPGRLWHVAGTFDGKTLKLYLNGRPQAAKEIKGIGVIPSRKHLMIGGRNRAGCFYKGLIRDVRVYDYALMEDELLPIVAAPRQAEAARMRAAAERLYDDVPNWRPTAENVRFLENLRLMRWAASCSGNLSEFGTPELAAKRAAAIKNSGATAIFIYGRQNRLNHLHINDKVVAFDRLVAEAGHARGIRVFDHIDFTIFWQAAYPVIFKHPDWAQRDLRYGTAHRWCCFNHPEYRDFYARYLEELVRAGIDGFMLDEINYRKQKYCGCEHCRRRFERETGFRLPEYWNDSVIGNRDNPLWRLWQEWQKKVLVEFKAFLLTRLQKINPDVMIFTYSTCIYRRQVLAGDMLEQSRVCFIGTEGTNTTYPISPYLFGQMRILSSMARLYGQPAHGEYPSRSAEESVFASAFLAALTGVHPWKWQAASLNWPHLEEALVRGEPVADVGVLLSTSTRDGNELSAGVHAAETFGWCQAFGLSGVQFDPIPGLYARSADLARFRAIVLPYCVNMPKQLIDRIVKYVQQGGVAVVTGVPGRRDRLGFPLGKEALFRRMKIRAISTPDVIKFNRREEVIDGGTERVLTIATGELRNAPRRLSIPNTFRFDAALETGARCEVLARFKDGAPAVLSLPSGKGRYIYLGFLPAAPIHQPRMYSRRIWRGYHKPEVVALMKAIAREATGGKDRIAVDADGLLTATYKSGNRLWVRMVNVAGIRSIPIGKEIGSVAPTYPDVGVVRLNVRMPVAAVAALFSPDRKERLDLKVVREGDGGIITIPAGAFRRFAFVRLEVAR